jgi:hypothetical protein
MTRCHLNGPVLLVFWHVGTFLRVDAATLVLKEQAHDAGILKVPDQSRMVKMEVGYHHPFDLFEPVAFIALA